MSGLGFYRGRDSKYNARPTRCRQGVTHHSAMESARCDELHVMQQGGLMGCGEEWPCAAWPLWAALRADFEDDLRDTSDAD
jgi:hypothetical protein